MWLLRLWVLAVVAALATPLLALKIFPCAVTCYPLHKREAHQLVLLLLLDAVLSLLHTHTHTNTQTPMLMWVSQTPLIQLIPSFSWLAVFFLFTIALLSQKKKPALETKQTLVLLLLGVKGGKERGG